MVNVVSPTPVLNRDVEPGDDDGIDHLLRFEAVGRTRVLSRLNDVTADPMSRDADE